MQSLDIRNTFGQQFPRLIETSNTAAEPATSMVGRWLNALLSHHIRRQTIDLGVAASFMKIVVNGQIIPESAVDYEFDRLLDFYSKRMNPEALQAQKPELRRHAVEQAIGGKLLIDEAMRLDLRPDPEDIDDAYADLVERAGGDAALRRALAAQGMTEQALRSTLAQGLRVDMLVEKICEGIPNPTEDEMRAHFKAHQSEYRRSESVRAQHILARFDPAVEGARERARKRLDAIRQRAEYGADFEALAREHSDCPSGKESGGSLGWVARGVVAPEFERVIFDLQAGSVSDLVETKLGLHVIRVAERREGGAPSYSEAAESAREFLTHAKRGEAIKAYVDELRAKAHVRIDP